MVSQGDITLLQRITQPEAQSQSVSGSVGPACGERAVGGGVLQTPPSNAHCTGTGPPFRGERKKKRAFEPTQAWQGVS